MLQFCSKNNLVMSNTCFQHKRIHQFTRECRGRGLKSIIDYFLVRKRFMKLVKDVEVVRGAEVGSDHHFVLMKVKLRLQDSKEGTRMVVKKHIKVEKLRNPETRRVYQSGLASQCRDVNCAFQGGSVEECRLTSVSKACGVAKIRNRVEK